MIDVSMGRNPEGVTGHSRMNTRMFIIAAALLAAVTVSHSASLREQRFALSIESGSLTSVLEQLSHQTGLHIGAEISASKGRARRFGPFFGEATADEALKQLLMGTGLWYAWRDEDTVRLFLISSQRTNWSSRSSTAKEASDSIREFAGVHYETGSCGELPVGPFSPVAPITAETFWVELLSPHCPVIREPTSDIEPGSIDRLTVKGETEHTFSIEEMPRLSALQRIAEQAGVSVGYLSTDNQEEQALIGPIRGPMTLNEALKRAMRDSVLRVRWIADDTVNVEPAFTMVTYADMSKCPCNFGLPERWPLQTMTVFGSRLPVKEPLTGPVTTLDLPFIEATGASTIPELLNYIASQAFNHSRGYRANGAQYFEGRGFGAQYALVLINGHRAYGSAGDPLTNALDLNVVPLSAVERIEISLDRPSALYGTDAIGGTVNIVLRRDIEEGAARSTLGSGHGGSEKNLFTLLADSTWGNTKVGFVFDHMDRGDLLGIKRERWRDQNFTRYPDGLDYRLPFGAPPNVRSITGELPGVGASSGRIVIEPSGLAIRPGMNMQSALAYAAIVPEQDRSSLYGFANTDLGSAELNVAVLLGRQTASLQVYPFSVPGLVWGGEHPQNPFDVDVIIDALFTGLPPQKQEAESTLLRWSADLRRSFGDWGYSAFLVSQEDQSQAWFANEIDYSVLTDSLTTDDPAAALNILSDRPGEGPVPAGLIAPRQKNSYVMSTVQAGFNLSGRLASWTGGDITAEVGIAHRRESVRFDDGMGRVDEDRDISSIFSQLRIPILGTVRTSLLRSLDLNIGARRDFHSDVSDMTTMQYSLLWQPRPAIKVYAGYSELFRPPSLYELYLPRFELPFQIVDPQREEVAAITLVTGGNPLLHPTEGQSIDVGLSIHSEDGSSTSLNYWETRMRDRIWLVLLQDLMNVQSEDLAERIVRDEQTGRLLELDTTRANFGAVEARGFGFAFERPIRTSIGSITPRIEITRTLNFRYRNLPAGAAPMLDRAGVASPYGTVPSGRAVASLLFEHRGWRASAFARHHTSYRDYSTVAGAETKHRVPAQTIFDIKFTKDINDHLAMSVGANNVLDNQPPFAQVGGWEGYDPAQGDLVGREVYLSIRGSF
jgi:iron complex outermembrane recepter protein